MNRSFLKEKMEEPEFTKDPGITEPLDDHLGTFIYVLIGCHYLKPFSEWLRGPANQNNFIKFNSRTMCRRRTIGTYKERHAAER